MAELNNILKIACEMKASDVHLTIGIPPKMRLNGHLVNVSDTMENLTAQDTLEMADSIVNEKQKAHLMEYGELDMSYEISGLGRFRVNIFKQRDAYALVLRLISTKIPEPEKLGVPQSVIDLYKLKRGLVLVTGPTGSGKSTTLAAIIDKIKKVLGKQGFMMLRIDPYIPESIRDNKGNIINMNQQATAIIKNLKRVGFSYKGKNKFFETEKPRWEALVLLNKDSNEI